MKSSVSASIDFRAITLQFRWSIIDMRSETNAEVLPSIRILIDEAQYYKMLMFRRAFAS
jgi:hypothetical protein